MRAVEGLRIEKYVDVVRHLRGLAEKGEARVWLDPASSRELLR